MRTCDKIQFNSCGVKQTKQLWERCASDGRVTKRKLAALEVKQHESKGKHAFKIVAYKPIR